MHPGFGMDNMGSRISGLGVGHTVSGGGGMENTVLNTILNLDSSTIKDKVTPTKYANMCFS